MAISVPRRKRIPQFHPRPPRRKWKVIANLLCARPRLFPFYQMILRTVVAALQLNAALRKPCPIRPHLDLYIALPYLEGDTEMTTSLRSPKTGRPRLKVAKVYNVPGHRANPAPRRLALPAKLSPNPRRASGPPAHVANFVLLPHFVEPAAPPYNRPTTTPSEWKNGPTQGQRGKWGFFFFSQTRAHLSLFSINLYRAGPGFSARFSKRGFSGNNFYGYVRRVW